MPMPRSILSFFAMCAATLFSGCVDLIKTGGSVRHIVRLFVVASVVLLSGCFSVIDTEGPIGEPEEVEVDGRGFGVVRQEWGVPITTNEGQPILIQSMVYRHMGSPRRRPLVIINHGDPVSPSKRRSGYTTDSYRFAAHWFAQRGYNVVVALRAGFGGSQGTGQLMGTGCIWLKHEQAGNSVADEILKIVDHFREQDWVDRGNIVLVGQSWGGIGVVAAAARRPPGVRAVIDFAGITPRNRVTGLCNPTNAFRAFSDYAKSTEIPVLWVFSENDPYIEISHLQKTYAVYAEIASGPAELALMPPFGKNGHMLFPRMGGVPIWSPVVRSFLDRRVPQADGS